jgi:hypothetical protein
MDEMRSANEALQDRLENMYRSLSLSPNSAGGVIQGSTSLLTEMELSDSERSLNAARRPFSEIEEEDDDVECDNPEPVSATAATGEVKEVRHNCYS